MLLGEVIYLPNRRLLLDFVFSNAGILEKFLVDI